MAKSNDTIGAFIDLGYVLTVYCSSDYCHHLKNADLKGLAEPVW